MDRTYLNIGNLKEKSIDLSIILPKHAEGNPYDFGFAYNISQKINGRNVYAICYFMKTYNEAGNRLFDGDTLYNNTILYSALIDFKKNGVIDFNEDTDKVYITVIHDDKTEPNLIYVEYLFDALADDIRMLQQEGAPYVYEIPLQIRPRVVGMSVIIR